MRMVCPLFECPEETFTAIRVGAVPAIESGAVIELTFDLQVTNREVETNSKQRYAGFGGDELSMETSWEPTAKY